MAPAEPAALQPLCDEEARARLGALKHKGVRPARLLKAEVRRGRRHLYCLLLLTTSFFVFFFPQPLLTCRTSDLQAAPPAGAFTVVP